MRPKDFACVESPPLPKKLPPPSEAPRFNISLLDIQRSGNQRVDAQALRSKQTNPMTKYIKLLALALLVAPAIAFSQAVVGTSAQIDGPVVIGATTPFTNSYLEIHFDTDLGQSPASYDFGTSNGAEQTWYRVDSHAVPHIGAQLVASGPQTFTFNVGHLSSGPLGSSPGIYVGAGLALGTNPIVTYLGDDSSGWIQVMVGPNRMLTGCFTVVFGTPYDRVPFSVSWTPGNAAAQQLMGSNGTYVFQIFPGYFTVDTAGGYLTQGVTYKWYYQVR